MSQDSRKRPSDKTQSNFSKFNSPAIKQGERAETESQISEHIPLTHMSSAVSSQIPLERGQSGRSKFRPDDRTHLSPEPLIRIEEARSQCEDTMDQISLGGAQIQAPY